MRFRLMNIRRYLVAKVHTTDKNRWQICVLLDVKNKVLKSQGQ